MSNRRRSLFFLFTTLEFPPRVTTHKINLTPGGSERGAKGGRAQLHLEQRKYLFCFFKEAQSHPGLRRYDV